nr:bacteriohemerythrin [uncultured Holophaga sp.]
MQTEQPIAWTPDLETGHPEIDAQHKTLVQALVKLHAAIEAGQGEEELGWCLSFLKAYTRVHFRTEEALLQTASLDLAAHRRAHAEFLQNVDQLFARFLRGELGVITETERSLQHWLLEHIQSDDRVLTEIPPRP